MVLSIKKRFYFYKTFELDVWGLMKANLDINPCLYEDYFDEIIKNTSDMYAPLTAHGFFSSLKTCYKLPILSKKISKICSLFWYFSDLRSKKMEAKFGHYIYRFDELPPVKSKRHVKTKVIAANIVRLFYIIYKPRQFKLLAKKAFKKSGSFIDNYISLLEGRLCSVAYRAGFFLTLFDSLTFVKHRYLCVDGIYQASIYFYIKPMEIIGFNPIIKGTILWFLLRRLNRGMTLTCTPKYMYISYTFLLFFWKRIPKGRELFNPVGIDMLRLCNYMYYF